MTALPLHGGRIDRLEVYPPTCWPGWDWFSVGAGTATSAVTRKWRPDLGVTTPGVRTSSSCRVPSPEEAYWFAEGRVPDPAAVKGVGPRAIVRYYLAHTRINAR